MHLHLQIQHWCSHFFRFQRDEVDQNHLQRFTTLNILCFEIMTELKHVVHGPRGVTVHPPPPPGSSTSGIILFSEPHWSIIEMLTPYKLGRPHLFGHFSKWPPSKSSENWIAHILTFGQLETQIWCLNPHFQGHWVQWECYKFDNVMYWWEIQDGWQFQLTF